MPSQASLHIRAVSPDQSLLAHATNERWRFKTNTDWVTAHVHLNNGWMGYVIIDRRYCHAIGKHIEILSLDVSVAFAFCHLNLYGFTVICEAYSIEDLLCVHCPFDNHRSFIVFD